MKRKQWIYLLGGCAGLVGWLFFVLAVVTGLTAAAGTAMLRGYVLMMQFFHHQGASGIWHALVWGPPALLAVIALTAVVQVGLMGIDFPDPGREWLSRLRAVTEHVRQWLFGRTQDGGKAQPDS